MNSEWGRQRWWDQVNTKSSESDEWGLPRRPRSRHATGAQLEEENCFTESVKGSAQYVAAQEFLWMLLVWKQKKEPAQWAHWLERAWSNTYFYSASFKRESKFSRFLLSSSRLRRRKFQAVNVALCSFDPFSGLSKYQIKYSEQCLRKAGQIFLKYAVLAEIHVTILYNFHPAHEKTPSFLSKGS